jgi:hypothetical protein
MCVNAGILVTWATGEPDLANGIGDQWHVRVVRAAALGQLPTEYRAVRHMFHLKVPLCPVCCLQAALSLRRTVVGSIYLRGRRATGEGPT